MGKCRMYKVFCFCFVNYTLIMLQAMKKELENEEIQRERKGMKEK